MSRILTDDLPFDLTVPVAIVGGGAAGLCAALAAREAGADLVVFERDALPQGSTALSAGLIPAAGTAAQRAAGIADGVAAFAADIQAKAHGAADPVVMRAVTEGAGPAVDWLSERHGLAFTVVADFSYPGHSARRMHGLASRSGAELIDRLRAAAEAAGVDIVTGAHVTALVATPAGRVRGLVVSRPDGSEERIGCDALVLACNGYGGNRALVAEHIPALKDALYFGHPGNQGDAVIWGRALGAELRQMSGHQGHGSVAHPHGILVTWAVIMEGGFQIDAAGGRFWNEASGYSEAALAVLGRPGGIAFDIFDDRIAGIARQFEDFRRAEAAGAVLQAESSDELANRLSIPRQVIRATLESVADLKRRRATDGFGRDWAGVPDLAPPYRAVKVTGALFHTQGGLAVDGSARVLRPGGEALPNLFAAGGAAVGVSGPEASGYLSGNGLLTAVVLGRIAGGEAARLASAQP
ncbi:FAD-dependent oxidoreductase [Phreatobacter cathodiphilus]|uniref:3-ketosteroid dehydrogenase n=1 Tax=Phreatobacter cathodiphilus TaxID=1868589 RepID=A0A2S0N8D7_9HYPH|nr:FAD-dependent oxidoreductase [Phreatobacter cathodiphilus]AVO44424.1 3-ketosteroid dehydrogenase [Phreatobacter cathodiphilus]